MLTLSHGEGYFTASVENTLLGGDIDDAAFPVAGEQSQATVFLPGIGTLRMTSKSFSLPHNPQQSSPVNNVTGRLFEGSGQVINNFIVTLLPVAVGGTIVLQGAQNAAQQIQFTFKPPVGTAFTRTATLAANGSYGLTNLPPNRYTVSIKGAKWMRKNITVDARAGNVTNANATLLAGDANGDNFDDIADLLLLTAHYNQRSPNAGFLDAADFTCDGINDISDLLLLIGNYNKQGDGLP